ncbi:MAG: ABC transporter permease [Acidobacteria bacterium]|nr:ABC transporter permease [Acidobacteriota bacterium]
MTYTLRRLLHGALLLFAISLASFLLASLAPGDFYTDLALDPRIRPETIAALRAQHHLDRPLPERYAAWAASVARGEFGYSLAYHTAAGPLIRERLPATLLLTASATLLAWLLALPIGIYHAVRRGRWQDRALALGAAVFLAVPELLLAIALLALAVETRWLPAGGMHSPGWESLPTAARWRDVLAHLAIPAAVLVFGMLPTLERHVRAAVADSLDAPFVLAARAHGIPRARILWRHVLPSAMHPLIALFGFSLGTLFSGSLLVEVLVGWPGLGPLFLDAVLARDFAIVLGVVMVSAAMLIAGNLAADLLLYRADPRIRPR